MIGYAERSFVLDRYEEGRTRRDRLSSKIDRAVRKGKMDVAAQLEAELDCPPFPMALNYIWQSWARIRRRKSQGMSGPNPIEWPDIDAFCRRTGTRLDPRDIELIEIVDDLYMQKSAEQASPADKHQAIKDNLAMAAKGKKRQSAD